MLTTGNSNNGQSPLGDLGAAGLTSALQLNASKTTTFALIVIRPVLSYVLSGLILLTQVGIPLHRHYCKGALESVSVFYAQKCDDHGTAPVADACCKKEGTTTSCSAETNSCCSDEVTVVSQQASYLTPSTNKWVADTPSFIILHFPTVAIAQNRVAHVDAVFAPDTGPPLYIRHHSLIIYA